MDALHTITIKWVMFTVVNYFINWKSHELTNATTAMGDMQLFHATTDQSVPLYLNLYNTGKSSLQTHSEEFCGRDKHSKAQNNPVQMTSLFLNTQHLLQLQPWQMKALENIYWMKLYGAFPNASLEPLSFKKSSTLAVSNISNRIWWKWMRAVCSYSEWLIFWLMC